MRQLVEHGKRAVRACSSWNKRARAFNEVLTPKGNMHESRKLVLKELYEFCHIGVIDHGTNETVIARLAGRREVWNRITAYMGYDPFDLDMLMKQMQEVEDE